MNHPLFHTGKYETNNNVKITLGLNSQILIDRLSNTFNEIFL